MFRKISFLLLFTTAFSMAMLSGTALGQEFSWTGATDAVFTTPGNWSTSVAPTDGIFNGRINVNNGSNHPLTYTVAQGHTIYNTQARSLVIAGTSSGAMIITGGTFESRSSTADVIGNGNTKTGSLTINGGNYIKTTGTGEASTFLIGLGSDAGNTVTSNLTVTSGSFSATTLNFGGNQNINGNVVGTLNLNGGVLTTGQIKEGTNVNQITSTINFNGGTLRALETRTDFINTNLTNAVVQSGGAIIDSNNHNIGIEKALTAGSPSGGLTKQGAGTLTLSGANTYTGSTTVNGGTLALAAAGSINNTSGVALGGGTFDVSAKVGGYTVNNLTGSGNVVGALTVSNSLAIGTSPGTINFDSLTLDAASTFAYEMDGGTNLADLGNVSQTLTLGGGILSLFQLGTYTLNDKFTLFGYQTGNLTGTFAGLANGAFTTDNLGGNWRINYADTVAGFNGGTGTSFVTITAIPEPSAALFGVIGSLLLLRRRR